MAGTRMSSNSQHHQSHSSTSGNNNLTATTGGRERAIEALIDREPQGDYYRAARVVDEAVPNANASRPNLVTKAALIEQAFSLSQYEIDTLAKYDEQYLRLSKDAHKLQNTFDTTKKVDALQRERIFHYLEQVLASKIAEEGSKSIVGAAIIQESAFTTPPANTAINQSTKSSTTLIVNPPPNVLATLRYIFTDETSEKDDMETSFSTVPMKLKVDTKEAAGCIDKNSSDLQFDLRHMLQSVVDHPIFTTNISSTVNVMTAQETPVVNVTSNDELRQQISLEKLIMNVVKIISSNGGGSDQHDFDISFQSLLIAVISLLAPPETNATTSFKDKKKFSKVQSESTSTTAYLVSRQDYELPFKSMLQVGPLMPLLPLSLSVNSSLSSAEGAFEDIELNDSTGHRLDSSMLDYFASAAAIYQERWEIRKARRLARMQTPPPPESTTQQRCHTPPPSLIFSSLQQKEADTSNQSEETNADSEQEVLQQNDVSQGRRNSGENLETPTAGDHGAADMEFSLRTEDDDVDAIVPTPVNVNTTTPPSNSGRNVDPPASFTDTEQIALANGDSSDSDGEEDGIHDHGQEDEGRASRPYDDAENIRDRNVDARPDEDDDDDEENADEPSSSGSESSDDGDEYNEGTGDSDDGDAVDTDDDDDDAVLRQAMALSISEQDVADGGVEAFNLVARTLMSLGIGPSSTADEDVHTDDDGNSVPTLESKAPVTIETPVSKSMEGSNIPSDELNDEANLPPFPTPPTTYQFLLPTILSTPLPSSDESNPRGKSHLSIPQLDPSKLSDFGSIPSRYVLLYLLRYARTAMNRRLVVGSKPCSSPSVVEGGVGSSLFEFECVNTDQTLSDIPKEKKMDFTLQLLVASTLIMIEQREEAIENLRKSIAREQRLVRDGVFDSDEENEIGNDDGSTRMPLSSSGEEDDPALTLAMNYVEDDAPLSSESLESKGMTRKAAAAAYEAAAMLKSLRQSTDCWKNEVNHVSSCVLCVLQIFRKYLQSMVRQLFTSGEINRSVSFYHVCLPQSVHLNLSQGLSSLMSISNHSSVLAMMSGDVIETERLFQSFSLYKEALLLWVECNPLLFPSDEARSSLLRSMVDECSGFAKPIMQLSTLEKLNTFPTLDVETQFFKVTALSRRLRIRDLLDGLVSKPLHVGKDMSFDDGDENVSQSNTEELLGPRLASKTINFLRNALESFVGDYNELKLLYLALCHRCQCQTLLFDGFYLETETESDDRHTLLATAKKLSTGDTVRVAAGPSSVLQFDVTKCSDSIAVYTGPDDDSRAVSPGICSVHQRASKVWGTVLSTQQFSPKTGIHRWAVRLDKCERGHVFIGVATSQATVKTYVGGDKYGWGMIGTQALWHDRRKIRGDYGSTFRTGSTIVVTLDTDAGTLGFSSWKDGTTSTSLSVDPLIQNIVSPRKLGQIGGIVEDWGVAFEGLPLDAKLYPAIALYQRDDRVTLLTVESPGAARGIFGASDVSGGRCYYPIVNNPSQAMNISFPSRVRHYNDLLTWDGTCYALGIIDNALCSIRKNDMKSLVLTSVLPSLAAALCLLPPAIPILSARYASYLMPQISTCILELESHFHEDDEWNHSIFSEGMSMGHWILRGKLSEESGADYEEYEVDLTAWKKMHGSLYFKGEGTSETKGKLKGRRVNIFGCIAGSSVTFVEDWYPAVNDEHVNSLVEPDTRVVAARLSIDGNGFEGFHRNVTSGVSEQIAGRIVDMSVSSNINTETSLGACAAILCLAQSHLAAVLGDYATNDLEYLCDDVISDVNDDRVKCDALKVALSGQLLKSAAPWHDELIINDSILLIQRQHSPPNVVLDDPDNMPSINILSNLNDFMSSMSHFTDLTDDTNKIKNLIAQLVSSVDSLVVEESGGFGSFSGLCFSEYSETRKKIICTVLYHSGCDGNVKYKEPGQWTDDVRSYMQCVWRSSLSILEDAVRKALSMNPLRSAREKCFSVCSILFKAATFLLTLKSTKTGNNLTVNEVANEISYLFSIIEDESDLKFIEKEMIQSTRRGLFRFSSLREIAQLIAKLDVKNMALIESLIVGLPRLLGKGKGEQASSFGSLQDDNSRFDCMPYLDGNYLFRLSGSDYRVVAAIRNLVISLFAGFGKIADQVVLHRSYEGSSWDIFSLHDSLMLSILVSFIGHFRLGDFKDILSESRLLSFLPKVLASHRYSVSQRFDTDNVEGDLQLQCTLLGKLIQRDISRAILRCSVAVAHVVTYQGNSYMDACFFPCVDLLLSELSLTFPIIEQDSISLFEDEALLRSKRDWQCYLSCLDNEETPVVANPLGVKTVASGVSYLQLQGTLLTNLSHGSSAKSLQSQKSPSSGNWRQTTDSPNNLISGFAYQFLSHWIHILCSVLRSPAAVTYIMTDSVGLSVLISRIGLSLEKCDDGTFHFAIKTVQNHKNLPGRFRSRLLRLMLPIFSTMEANESLVFALFVIVGSTSNVLNQSSDQEDWLVSRETVSLLRHLYAPLFQQWRACINDVISTKTQEQGNEIESIYVKVGILSFFSGNLEAICRGSYVLIKPSAASVLSMENQSLPSGKSHLSGMGGSSLSTTSAGSTSHHLIGNGTSSVIAGLCRAQASAGIVSNIDLKNGSCEVILVARGQNESIETGATSEMKHVRATSHGKSVIGGRHTLSVRAVRTSLSDVVHAQEVPMYLDGLNSVESLLGNLFASSLVNLVSTTSLNSVDNEIGLTLDLMTLRCCVVILSDERILSAFLGRSDSKNILVKLLELAWPENYDEDNSETYRQIQMKNISDLVNHEARFSHLIWLFRDLKCRMIAMKNTSEGDKEDILTRLRLKIISGSSSAVGLGSETPGIPDPSTTSNAIPNAIEPKSTSRDDEGNVVRSTSHSTTASSVEDEEENSEAATTAAEHLREAAIAQMSELGLPRSWSEFALRRTGGVNIEAAVTFCLERGPEIERMIADEQERDRLARNFSTGSMRRRGTRDTGPSSRLLRQLLEMGFPKRWCTEALSVTGNNVDEALTWILNNGERLSEEDEAIDAGEENEETNDDDAESVDDDEDEDEDIEVDDTPDENQKTTSGILVGTMSNDSKEASEPLRCWSGSITPLSFISGRAIVDPVKMEISGLPAGGFSSVGTKGVLLSSGKWYYEAILETAGCLQIGWADASFAGHCHAERGDGCGDGPSSWAFDGWRRYRWHATATEWGCRWKEGDVVGCLVDMDSHVISFTLNGQGESIGMGVAFSGEGFRPCSGVYACVSFNRKEKLRLILGGSGSERFIHDPPENYRGVGEAVLEAVKERDLLLSKELVLDSKIKLENNKARAKKFLCDFSDTDHGHELTAWAHRYYGSDASVYLGSGRSKQNSSKLCSNSTSSDQLYSSFLTRRLQKAWNQSPTILLKNVESELNYEDLASRCFEGYEEVQRKLNSDLCSEGAVLAILLARKLLLHLIITAGQEFSISVFTAEDKSPLDVALRFWNVVEVCTSLRSAGWIGEAGAMAIAAEALGLCISSNDQSPRSVGERRGVVIASELDENLLLPVGGFTQILTPVLTKIGDTSHFKAASAEAAMASDGGSGILAFLLEGLQSAVCRSKAFRAIIVAKIRRSIRYLGVVEYENDDYETSGKKEDDGDEDAGDAAISSSKYLEGSDEDARLISFFSGLLLSKPVQFLDDFESIQQELFEAWSIGLLSASLPWRMICAFTAAGVLNLNPNIFSPSLKEKPTVARYFGRLQSTVARRLWAERAAYPVCSRYAQSLIELLTSVHRAVNISNDLPIEFCQFWNKICVDAATPLPFVRDNDSPCDFWESEEGWVSSDTGFVVWTGVVQIKPCSWKVPSRSSVRTLMDGGDGPPLVRQGCIVMRGVDWDQKGNTYGNDDGKDIYETEKEKREKEKVLLQEPMNPGNDVEADTSKDVTKLGTDKNESDATCAPDPAEECEDTGLSEAISDSVITGPDPSPFECEGSEIATTPQPTISEEKKMKRVPSPRLPIGTVLSIEPWNGLPGMALRVKWHLTGIEGVYRFGGDGGRYDLCHVDVNSKETKVKKRYPLPESSEQCAARHGFGVKTTHSIILRLRTSSKQITVNGKNEYVHDGILEWPDYGAGTRVACTRHSNGTFSVEELQLLFGSKDSGWIPRFGQPSFVAGSRFILSRIADADSVSTIPSMYDELSGNCEFNVQALRNPEDGGFLKVSSEMRLRRGVMTNPITSAKLPQTMSPHPPPLVFERQYCSSSLSLSQDCRTVSCTSSDSGRGTVFGSLGFTKGVHYWEVKLEQADVGSVFIGVAEKPIGSGSGSSYVFDATPRLNRWHGWGFVNFRATYTAGAERVYGSHCHTGDTVGVMLDCDSGRVSFFFDGLKYGEHILNDLGCAFENLSPFGFNVDGCGSGGSGQNAPSGFENGSSNRFPAQGTIRPRTLWPVVGLRNHGDRVTLSPKWSTSFGIDGVVALRNIVKVDTILSSYFDSVTEKSTHLNLPQWFINEAFSEYKRWYGDEWTRAATRGSGPFRDTGMCLDVDFDSSPLACAAASASLGLQQALLAGDRVKLTRSAGRILQLAEEAIVVGVYQGRLFYRIVSQKSEGGSLTEGGGRAWCWDESEVVDGLSFVSPSKGCDILLPKLSRFCCRGSGLKVVYGSGAVIRSDLEIFDGSETLGTIPVGTVIPKSSVIDRRLNSCGGVRYRIRCEKWGEGWISERIRGGTEEQIVETIDEVGDCIVSANEQCYDTPLECAAAWYSAWKDVSNDEMNKILTSYNIASVEEFSELTAQAIIPGLSALESDSVLTSVINAISNSSNTGDSVELSFREVFAAVTFAHATANGVQAKSMEKANASANQVAATTLSKFSRLPSQKALLARISLLRSFNRRTRLALPWLSIRPCQEGSAILGGLYGQGTCPDRSARCHDDAQSELWVQVPSIATKIRSLRGIFFTSVKRGFLRTIVDATTTSTLLSHDEYELPREIRTVRINRLKAARAMLGDDISSKRKYSVFSQLHNETKSWGGASLRRGFVAKGHGGQKRAFKVKLIGEGVNDYSGPYREAFTDAMADVLKIESDTRCSLAVLDPTPNNASSIGDNRDLFMFSLNGRNVNPSIMDLDTACPAEKRIRRNFASLMVACDESSREVEESLVFLGRLVGTAFRHGIPLDIPLPLYSVWKALTEQPMSSSQKLLELDHLAHKQLMNDSDANDAPLLVWQQRMLNAFTEGLGNVLPVEILPLLSGEELRETMCGNPNVDVELLKQIVEYEGYSPTDDVITYFWSTLNEMTNDERKMFLQFVWARNRLPMRASDFDAPFKIQKDTSKSEQALPSASTCFFTLTLPEYHDQETLREKLLFAIQNVTTMETDFQTNSAEIAEGYRSF